MTSPLHRPHQPFLLDLYQGKFFQYFAYIYLEYHIFRLVIPIKKILLSEEALARPIPTLSDRQFVLTQSSLSQVDQRTQRELFWYREELFKVVSGRWCEVFDFTLSQKCGH